MAPRLRTKPEPARSRLIVAGLVALALLALGEQAPGAFPVHVSIVGHSATGDVQVDVDGESHAVMSALGGDWRQVVLEEPQPVAREYQIDGSDVTSTGDRDPQLIAGLLGTPLYWLDAFLRDESSYSRWQGLSIVDLGTGGSVGADGPLPSDFRLDVDLRRPEALARVWLVDSSGGQREGLELDRDQRNARWVVDRGGGIQPRPRWFFPEQAAPFAAGLLELLGRSVAAGYALVLVALALGHARSLRSARNAFSLRGFKGLPPLENPRRETGYAGAASGAGPRWQMGAGGPGGIEGVIAERVPDVTLAIWLVGAAVVATQQYRQLPHILDAISYTFQAGVFASGQLSIPVPPQAQALKGPFVVVWQGRMFSQYPPGAAAFYALGKLVNLEWLVGPIACTVLIGATAWTARRLFGPVCGLTALGLGVISPFVLFQAGSFLSHPIAGGLAAAAIAAFVAGERTQQNRWYAACGVLLGATFLVREVAALLVGLPLGVRLVCCHRWTALRALVVCGVPWLLAYLLYNWLQTGNPFLLPRVLFDSTDHFGFGDGIGFHGRHTLAAGLANTDELLTLLQLDLFGWPPLFAFGLLLLPFLLGRAQTWDWMALGGFGAFVVAYIGYFYHGIALGPRYYFEAMPWLLLLGARGVQVLTDVAASQLAAGLLVAALTLNTVLFYTPAELNRRTDFGGAMGQPRSLGFVRTSLLGPQLVGVPGNALVVTDDWWLFNTALSGLNCPQLPDCDVLFALAPTAMDVDQLRAEFPARTLLRTVESNGDVTLAPYAA